MNKYLIIAASALALAGCSSDDFLGDGSGNGQNNAAIQFGGGTTKTHRAMSTGVYKIENLTANGFWVYGTKHSAAEDKTATYDQAVYTNYYLNYTKNSANNTQSNTAGWEYVGVDKKNTATTSPLRLTLIKPSSIGIIALRLTPSMPLRQILLMLK